MIDGPLARRLPWWLHAAAVLAIALTILLRFYPRVTSPPRADEKVYLRAFERVAVGVSPYVDTERLGYYYPPPFALVGSSWLKLAGTGGVVALFRVANVVGLACCLWIAMLLSPAGLWWCLGLAGMYVAIGPPALQHGFTSGNISFGVVGASLVALTAWRALPLASGLLLALSSIIKPVAPLGLVALGTHRPVDGGRRHLWTAASGLMVAAALTAASPFLTEYLALDADVDEWPLRRSLSLYRWLHLLGLSVSPVLVVALVTLATVWVARSGRRTPRQLLVLAITSMTLATPVNWSHTLMLTLPLQVLAVSRVWSRWRAQRSRAVVYEAILVVLAAAALQFADGLGGGVEAQPALLQALVVGIGVWAPVGLALYVWRSAGEPVQASDPG